MASTERRIWTIAYRKPTGPWFQRVDLELTWAQAIYATQSLGQVRPDLDVWYTTTKSNDERALADARNNTSLLAQDYAEDAYNIMVESGKRVKVKDTGKLDPRVCILPAHIARAQFEARADRYRVH